MPFPIGHALVGACVYTATRHENNFSNLRILILCCALTIVPDFDFIFAWGFDLDGWHRGFTHSIVFALGIGSLAAGLGSRGELRDAIALILASISHTALDGLTTRAGTGVELLWPFTSHRFHLGAFDYFNFNPNPKVTPWGSIFFLLMKGSAVEVITLGPVLALLVFKRKYSSV